jgi:thymidylate synthase
MIKNFQKFGYNIYGNSIGEMWFGLLEAVLTKGGKSFDEKRERLALMNVRVKSESQNIDDELITKYVDQKKTQAMIDFVFSNEIIEDIDVVKSFQRSAKSYCQRIKAGRMVEFVIKRLSVIPESKKAVIVFPTYEDYAKIFDDQYINDYLPCLVAIQFRLVKNKKTFILNTTFYARSIDVFQKAQGNFLSIAKLSSYIASEITKNLGVEIKIGFLDGIIADAHIYKETLNEAKKTLKRFKNDQKKLE